MGGSFFFWLFGFFGFWAFGLLGFGLLGFLVFWSFFFMDLSLLDSHYTHTHVHCMHAYRPPRCPPRSPPRHHPVLSSPRPVITLVFFILFWNDLFLKFILGLGLGLGLVLLLVLKEAGTLFFVRLLVFSSSSSSLAFFFCFLFFFLFWVFPCWSSGSRRVCCRRRLFNRFDFFFFSIYVV